MSKIICDVCGTAYQDTASQCPICGCATGGSDKAADGTYTESADSVRRSSGKGGRFTKSNVRKRNTAQAKASRYNEHEDYDSGEDSSSGGNKVVTIAVIVLLIAVLLVASYIVIRFFVPEFGVDNPGSTTTEPVGDATDGSSQTDPPEVPCTDIVVDNSAPIEFDAAGMAWLLNVSKEPANTTDEITFTSSDEAVVTVTQQGRVTSVGGGEAVITITCGDIVKEVTVLCNFESANPTDPSDDPTDPSTTPSDPSTDVELTLNKSDITLSNYGNTYQFKVTGANAADVTWTSDKPEIASVSETGKVTALSPGNATITAEYNGQTATCIVRCAKTVVPQGEAKYKLNFTDVTISVGETQTLRLTDADNAPISVTWTCSEPDYVEVVENKITGLKPTAEVYYARVYCEYEGETYTCIVRVRGE